VDRGSLCRTRTLLANRFKEAEFAPPVRVDAGHATEAMGLPRTSFAYFPHRGLRRVLMSSLQRLAARAAIRL